LKYLGNHLLFGNITSQFLLSQEYEDCVLYEGSSRIENETNATLESVVCVIECAFRSMSLIRSARRGTILSLYVQFVHTNIGAVMLRRNIFLICTTSFLPQEYGDKKRCFQPSLNADDNLEQCPEEYVFNPANVFSVLDNRHLAKASKYHHSQHSSSSSSSSSSGSFSSGGSASGHSEAVQISPQHVSLKLRISEFLAYNVEYLAITGPYPGFCGVDAPNFWSLAYTKGEKLSSRGALSRNLVYLA
jgi:Integrin, beta chain.